MDEYWQLAAIFAGIKNGCSSKPCIGRASLMRHCIAAKKKYKLRHPIVRKSVPSTFLLKLGSLPV